MTLPQRKQKNWHDVLKQRVHHWPWLLRDHVIVCALALSVLGLILIVLGLIFSSVSALQGVGGIVFGTGLTVILSQLANRQQLAKDANLRRKKDVYEPLHAELQALRERLETTRAGDRPYLPWIDVPGIVPAERPCDERPPSFQFWSAFQADVRRLDFSERTRQLLNQILQQARYYNTAIDDALTASETILAPAIEAAMTRTTDSEALRQWDQRISDRRAWARFWLRNTGGASGFCRPVTLGWLLAENREQAVQAIERIYALSGGSDPPPPREWIEAIIEEVWPTLQSQRTFATVQTRHEELFQQVSQAETKLLDTLHDIQNIYEGGPPSL